MIPSAPPCLPELGVIALVPDPWWGYWMPRHQLMARLARYFPVVWVEPARDWTDAIRGRRTPAPMPAGPAPPPGLFVLGADQGPPRVYRPATAARLAARLRLRRARRHLHRRGARWIVLYLWRPEYGDALDLVEHDASVYHVDDEYGFYGAAETIDPREEALLRRVDRAFIHSPALLEKKGHLNPQTTPLPNGVDYAAFATPVDEPADLRGVPRPRLVYCGMLKRQLDWELLEGLAERRPEWSLVLVGPVAPHPEVAAAAERMRRRPNVHLLGPKPVDALPAYAQHADVCLMPYRADRYTQFIYPLKLHEYLATGNPVVATRIRSLEDFAAVVVLRDDPGGWPEAIEAALEPAARTPERRAERQAVARRHDWDALAERLARTLAAGLSPELERRLLTAAPAATKLPA